MTDSALNSIPAHVKFVLEQIKSSLSFLVSSNLIDHAAAEKAFAIIELNLRIKQEEHTRLRNAEPTPLGPRNQAIRDKLQHNEVVSDVVSYIIDSMPLLPDELKEALSALAEESQSSLIQAVTDPANQRRGKQLSSSAAAAMVKSYKASTEMLRKSKEAKTNKDKDSLPSFSTQPAHILSAKPSQPFVASPSQSVLGEDSTVSTRTIEYIPVPGMKVTCQITVSIEDALLASLTLDSLVDEPEEGLSPSVVSPQATTTLSSAIDAPQPPPRHVRAVASLPDPNYKLPAPIRRLPSIPTDEDRLAQLMKS